MKKSRTIRQELLVRFLVAAVIPLLIFAWVTQSNIWKRQQNSVADKIQASLRNSDKCFTMVMEKYSAVLKEICTEEAVLDIAERMDQKSATDADREQLQNLVREKCEWQDGVEGIVMSFSDGTEFAYGNKDENEPWIHIPKQQAPAEISGGTIYQTFRTEDIADGEAQYLFRINGEITGGETAETKDSKKVYGWAAILINESAIRAVLDSTADSKTWILDGDTVVSAPEREKTGKAWEQIQDKKHHIYTEKENELTGFTISNEQSKRGYYESFLHQLALFLATGILSLGVSFALVYTFTKPYLKMIDEYTLALKQLESGDFTARVGTDAAVSRELTSIAEGFNQTVIRTEQLMEQTRRVAEEQRIAELSALEAQIDPHFLYNTLDAINWKAIENEQYEISELLGAMADIFRHSVENTGGLTTLGKALGWLRHYVLLQSVKLGRQPELIIKVDEELKGFRMHKLLLQPFVENAVKYGFLKNEEECTLTVEAKLLGDQLHVVIEDNGCGMDKMLLKQLNSEKDELNGHMGIANVRKRMKLYYGEEAKLYFESEKGRYTRVHLFIPKAEEEEKTKTEQKKEGQYENCSCGGRSADPGGDGKDFADNKSQI